MRDKPTHLPTAKRGGFQRDMKNLFDLVKNISEEVSAEIIYKADCGFPKKSGLGNVSKVVSGKVQLNYCYVEEVRKRIAEKGGDPTSFTEERLPWGQWELANKVIAHNGKRYLRYYVINDEVLDVIYFVDGVRATAKQTSDIKAYIASKKKSSDKQSACGLKDKEQVMPRNVDFDNVKLLQVGDEIYKAWNEVA